MSRAGRPGELGWRSWGSGGSQDAISPQAILPLSWWALEWPVLAPASASPGPEEGCSRARLRGWRGGSCGPFMGKWCKVFIFLSLCPRHCAKYNSK